MFQTLMRNKILFSDLVVAAIALLLVARPCISFVYSCFLYPSHNSFTRFVCSIKPCNPDSFSSGLSRASNRCRSRLRPLVCALDGTTCTTLQKATSSSHSHEHRCKRIIARGHTSSYNAQQSLQWPRRISERSEGERWLAHRVPGPSNLCDAPTTRRRGLQRQER